MGNLLRNYHCIFHLNFNEFIGVFLLNSMNPLTVKDRQRACILCKLFGIVENQGHCQPILKTIFFCKQTENMARLITNKYLLYFAQENIEFRLPVSDDLINCLTVIQSSFC